MSKRSASAERATAVHEAGHAVAHYFLRVPIRHVTIVEDEDNDGHVLALRSLIAPPADESSTRYLRWVEGAEQQITICFSGMLAQIKQDARSLRSFHSHSDRRKAVEIASHIVGDGPVLQKYIDFRYEVARALVELRWPQIVDVADELMQRRTLSWKQLQGVILKSLGISPA